MLIVLLGYSLFYGIWVGIAAGMTAVAWRMFGGWAFVPVVLVPTAIALSLWLCGNWIRDAGWDALDAFTAAAAKLEPLRGGHAGFDSGLLIVILPVLIVHYSPALLDAEFLWQLFQFCLVLGLAAALGLVPSTLVSTGLLSWSLIKRLKERYRVFLTVQSR